MKKIKLKEKTIFIKSCSSEECPCFECHIDAGYCEAQYGDSCNLGASVDDDTNGEFPTDCPLEDA